MQKLVLGSVALAALVAGPVMAADLPVKAPPVVRPACAQFGGVYLGGHVGGNSYRSDYKDVDSLGNVVTFNTALGLPLAVSDTHLGWHGGVQGGYNWQTNCTVFGVETDWSWTNAKASSVHHSDPATVFNDSLTLSSRMRWFGTARARSGVVVDNLLLYVTGGLAYANFDRDLSFFRVGAVITPGPIIVSETLNFSHRSTRLGWTAGFGSEWAINANWSLKGELLYMQFEKDTNQLTAQVAGRPPAAFQIEYQDSVWAGRIGLNYRWGAVY
jgi:outer membrane immunogenic protein